MKTYTVLIGYISFNGQTIQPGEYTELEIDVAEARNKSQLVETVNVLSSFSTEEVVIKEVNLKTVSATSLDTDTIKDIHITPTLVTHKVNSITINTATQKELEDLKYVAAKTASHVITERNKKQFTSYADLNQRVPLKFKKQWEDVAVLDFESTVKKVHSTLNFS